MEKVCLLGVGLNCVEWRDVTERWEAQGTSRRTMLSLGRILCCWSEFEYIKENLGKKEKGVQHSLCSLGPLCGKRSRLPYVFSPPFWPYSQLLILHFKVYNYAMRTLVQELQILPPYIKMKCQMCCSSVVVHLLLMKVSIATAQIRCRCIALQ